MAKGKRLRLLTELLSDEQVLQLIAERLGQFVIISDTEPENGPVLWFDTSTNTSTETPEEDGVIMLVLNEDSENAEVAMTIDDVEYAVENAESPVETDVSDTYSIYIT